MDSSRKLNASLYRKTRKLLSSPGLFFRDYFNRKYPLVLNEIRCSIGEEAILIENDLNIERKIQVDLPIDVVFTWVNDKDPVWKEKFYYHQRHLHGDGTQYDFDPARYNNNNEIIFAINSVITFMPWVRRIFIVTDNQIPEAF
ncbi:MAG TPA: capsule biosynthesis protein CapC, partial [Franconibacter pulveris]|nr:capsule biosynthesis protein CapC [Franconibacter pulveris]